jgi:hypothetical protein
MFTVHYASNGRKNCDLHLGITTKNHRILAGVLQRKCANCKRWENEDDFTLRKKVNLLGVEDVILKMPLLGNQSMVGTKDNN